MTDTPPPALPRLDAITLHDRTRLVLTTPQYLNQRAHDELVTRIANWSGHDFDPAHLLVLDGGLELKTADPDRPGRVDELLEANTRLHNRVVDLSSAVAGAAATFRDYERQHRAKGTPEGNAKADVNAAKATSLEALLPGGAK